MNLYPEILGCYPRTPIRSQSSEVCVHEHVFASSLYNIPMHKIVEPKGDKLGSLGALLQKRTLLKNDNPEI